MSKFEEHSKWYFHCPLDRPADFKFARGFLDEDVTIGLFLSAAAFQIRKKVHPLSIMRSYN